MNVFDWLSDLPLHDSAKPYPIIEVSFNKGSRKEFFRNNTNHLLEKGECITVEGVSGFDVGQISLMGELVKLQMKKYGVKDTPELKRVLRPASEDDLRLQDTHKQREAEVLIRSRAIARYYKLEMKLAEVEIQADGKKATFFYTADARVDFRELIKAYASEFKVKVEMRQIGARQESGKVGGIGSCGRELCCSTWLTDFKSVNTAAARYQNLSINQTKLSGQCGRLKCCLNYELDTYMDALRVFPNNAEVLETSKGRATLQKRDIFKNLMWYSYSDSTKQYPMSIERVKEIQQLNKEGIKPDELQPVELETPANKAGMKVDMGFVNDVGQITLKALEKGNKRRKGGGGSKGQGGQREAAPAGSADSGNQRGGRDRRGGQGGGGNAQQGNRQGQPRQQGEGRDRQQQRPPRPQGQGGGERPQGSPDAQPRQRGEGRGQRPPRPEGGQGGGGDRPQGGEGRQGGSGNRGGRNRPRRDGGGEGAQPKPPGEAKP